MIGNIVCVVICSAWVVGMVTACLHEWWRNKHAWKKPEGLIEADLHWLREQLERVALTPPAWVPKAPEPEPAPPVPRARPSHRFPRCEACARHYVERIHEAC